MPKIIIKDIPKLKVICTKHTGFTAKKALALIPEVLGWLTQQNVSISGLPLSLVSKNKDFRICIPIQGKISKRQNLSIEILPAHRMGITIHNEPKKPLMFSEEYLEGQLRYQGFTLSWPRRFIFKQNTEDTNNPLIEIQIPIHK